MDATPRSERHGARRHDQAPYRRQRSHRAAGSLQLAPGPLIWVCEENEGLSIRFAPAFNSMHSHGSDPSTSKDHVGKHAVVVAQ